LCRWCLSPQKPRPTVSHHTTQSTHPGVGGGTHCRRATFQRSLVFVGGVRLGVRGVVLVVCVCVGDASVVLCRCVCVCDLLIFLHCNNTESNRAPLEVEPSENIGKGGGVVHVVLISSEATPYCTLPHYTRTLYNKINQGWRPWWQFNRSGC